MAAVKCVTTPFTSTEFQVNTFMHLFFKSFTSPFASHRTLCNKYFKLHYLNLIEDLLRENGLVLDCYCGKRQNSASIQVRRHNFIPSTAVCWYGFKPRKTGESHFINCFALNRQGAFRPPASHFICRQNVLRTTLLSICQQLGATEDE